MDTGAKAEEYKEKWYKKRVFPLAPIIEYRKGDKHNSRRLYFSWLFLVMWDAMAPHLGLSAYIEGHGIGIQVHLPWLHIRAGIPFPRKIDFWLHEYFWSIGERSKFKWLR